MQEIKSIKNYKKLDVFLNKYLTPKEMTMLEKRLGVFYLLGKGLSYREISKELDITLKTISFTKSGFKKPEKRLAKENFKSKNINETKRKKRYKPLLGIYKGAPSII